MTVMTATTPSTLADRVSTAAMLLAPLLGAVATGVMPAALGERHGTDRAKTLEVIGDAASSRTGLATSTLLVTLALALMVPAALGLARAAGWRTTALVGAGLVVVGAPMGVAANATSAYLLSRVTDPAVPRPSGVDVLARSSGGPWLLVLVLYLVPMVAGLVLLGIALGRSGFVPRWVGALIAVGGVVSFMAPEGVVGAVCAAPLIVGFGLVALRRDRELPLWKGSTT